jgi:DNA helicase II / ATP-dependent DNA helicase PcrA
MSTPALHNQQFLDFLATLNPAQRRAVEQTEGPVLVIAGPGTGKTHILTARIGHILLNTDARPQNILCLTFTDAGANAMRQRLLERIGPESYRVPIHTFHAFCNRVIQDNLEYFGKSGLEPLSDLERIEIIRRLLGRLPLAHPLRAGKKDAFQYEEALRNLFALMKKEGWTPGYVIKQCDEFLKGLPQHPDYVYQNNSKYGAKGSPKTAKVAEITEKLERLKAAADLFPKYGSELDKAGRYEYADMLLWVIRAFEKNEALLRGYQERYQYVLVDEFQDTNGAQYHLLQLLMNFWETPNIFIVGDDDQSIYEFQGARLHNLLDFYRRHQPELQTIILDQNYRSVQAVLDSASRVIDENLIRAIHLFDAPLQKQLVSKGVQPPEILPGNGASCQVWTFDTRLHEVAFLVQSINTLLQSGVKAPEIAVLYAQHSQAQMLQQLLSKKGIAFQTRRPVNILDVPFIAHFRDLLTWIEYESREPLSGEHLLFRLLHAVFFDLDANDLALAALALHRLTEAAKKTEDEAAMAAKKIPLYEQAGGGRKIAAWRFALGAPEVLEALPLQKKEALYRVMQQLPQWISAAQNLALPQLITHLYTQTGLMQWAMQHPDKHWCLQVLHTFLDFVQQEAARHPRMRLGRLLELLDSMEDNRLPLPLQQAAQSASGVQLLTAHSAKGLEFSYVFMLDCTEKAWDKKSGGHHGQFTIPDTLTYSGEEDALEARRRLFYVAMTRAKHSLAILYSRADAQGKALAQSRFVIESGIPQTDITADTALLSEAQTLLLTEPEQPVILLPEAAELDELLANYTLSITALNRFLRCPLAFYYEDLMRVPGVTSEAAAFGIALHGALQQFFLKMKADKKQQWPSGEALLRMFQREMERQSGFFSRYAYDQRLALGRENLRRIYVEQVPHWRKRAIVERRVDRVEVNGVPMAGVLDKIEWLDGHQMRIVDFKTGQPDPKKTAAPDEKQPYGGDYWRQLAFYQLLLENARIYPEKVGKTAIAWLEPDKKGHFPITEIQFTQQELAQVAEMIRSVYAKIQAREFTTGCGKPDCDWCNIHRERRLGEAMPEDMEEGLDD